MRQWRWKALLHSARGRKAESPIRIHAAKGRVKGRVNGERNEVCLITIELGARSLPEAFVLRLKPLFDFCYCLVEIAPCSHAQVPVLRDCDNGVLRLVIAHF